MSGRISDETQGAETFTAVEAVKVLKLLFVPFQTTLVFYSLHTWMLIKVYLWLFPLFNVRPQSALFGKVEVKAISGRNSIVVED